ncbi:MAG: hypothetical protein ABSE63_13165 [Thermoguttaceae bacterium]|jgi:FtsH-binding integral membrane protein
MGCRSVKLISYTLSYAIIGGAIAFVFAFANSSSLILNTFLIAFFATLFGFGGYLQAKYPPPSKQDSNRPKKIQFSLLRLLLATSMVALVFGLSRYLYDFKDPAEIFASSLIAFALGGLTLISTKSDLKHIFYIVVVILGIIFVISFLTDYRR